MGVDVALEDENGDKLATVVDPTNVLLRALPGPEDAQCHWANTIDWYGNTTFNRKQAELLRKEWAILIQNAVDENTAALLKRVDELLQRCVSGVHLYVKFYGD